MELGTVIGKAEQYVKEELKNDRSGHDWWHIYRVRKMAIKIAKKEGANEFICELASLLHDVADEKLNVSKEAGLNKVQNWLDFHLADDDIIDHIMSIISTMSYNGGQNLPMTTLVGQVVQDADRLDAIGAIGIARTFAYAGHRGHLMHDPECTPSDNVNEQVKRNSDNTAINHFYEKLLKLKDLMNTRWGKKIAIRRHGYLEQYLEQFYAEWETADKDLENRDI